MDKSGCKNPMYGKHHEKNAKEKMSNKKVGIYDGINNPRARKLYQYDRNNNLIKIWNFAKECAELYGMSRGNVSFTAKCNTNIDINEISIPYKVVYGFIFKFH